MKVPAEELSDISFPECSKKCLAVEYLGCGECENVCPEKFPDTEETKYND